MKHGLFILTFACLAGWTCQAQSPPCREALSISELWEIEGGDLYLGVIRDKQMMTVTRVTPGDYRSTECYSVPVTTSVVRKQDVSPTNPKNSMENTERDVKQGNNTVHLKQFPTGTANLNATIGTQAAVEGPVIRTDATQQVNVVAGPKAGETIPDYGYNVHFADPAIGSNTLGCIGVTNLENMQRLAQTMSTDQATDSSRNQTVTVTPYSPPAAQKPAATPAPTAPTAPAAQPAQAPASTPAPSSSPAAATPAPTPSPAATPAPAPATTPPQSTVPPRTNVRPTVPL